MDKSLFDAKNIYSIRENINLLLKETSTTAMLVKKWNIPGFGFKIYDIFSEVVLWKNNIYLII